MRRNIAQPWGARGFEGNGWIKTTGDGAVDDGLFLFIQQSDGLALRLYRPI